MNKKVNFFFASLVIVLLVALVLYIIQNIIKK